MSKSHSSSASFEFCGPRIGILHSYTEAIVNEAWKIVVEAFNKHANQNPDLSKLLKENHIASEIPKIFQRNQAQFLAWLKDEVNVILSERNLSTRLNYLDALVIASKIAEKNSKTDNSQSSLPVSWLKVPPPHCLIEEYEKFLKAKDKDKDKDKENAKDSKINYFDSTAAESSGSNNPNNLNDCLSPNEIASHNLDEEIIRLTKIQEEIYREKDKLLEELNNKKKILLKYKADIHNHQNIIDKAYKELINENNEQEEEENA